MASSHPRAAARAAASFPSRLSTVAFALLLIGAHAVNAQIVHRPPRLIELFDFEDTDDQGVKLGLGHDLPRHFFVMGRDPLVRDSYFHRLPLHAELIGRSGYPHYSEVGYDTQEKISGDYSLRLTCDGGNTGVFLEVGTLAAVPGSNYRVTAKLRTADLRGAAARLTACFVDAAGRRILESERHTQALRTEGKWIDASVALPGDYPGAAWIGIELQLLQPEPEPDNVLGGRQLVFHDIAGKLWVDDVAVWQLPYVEVASANELNLCAGDEQPRFSLTMRDLTGRRLTATAVAYDHRLREVDRTTRRVGAGAPMQWAWEPNLPGYGWYLVDLTITDDALGAVVARTFGAVLWLAEQPLLDPVDAQRFMLAAEDIPRAQTAMIPSLLERTGLRSVVLSLWGREDELVRIEQRTNEIDDLINRIVSAERRVALSLYPVPRELAMTEGVNTAQPLGVLQSDPEKWMPYLRPMLHRHSQRVRHWQLGRSDQAEAFFYEDPDQLLGKVRTLFEQLAPGPRLVVPWRLDQSRRLAEGSPVTFALDADPGISAEGLAAYLSQWQAPPTSAALYLRESAADRLDPDSRAASLALKMIAGWSAQVDSLAIDRPWTEAAERRDAILPDPLLGVFINTAHRLGGRRVVADDLPIGEGLRAMVLNGQAGGLLIAWSQSAAPQDSVVRMILGDQPVMIDLWGNRSPVPMRNGKHELRLTQTPLFIEQIDPPLALMRAGFRLDEPFIESRQQPHRRQLILTNPFPITISGRLRITGPPGWDISPLGHPFSLAPGQSTKFPIVMKFPLAETAGVKQLTARVEFDAGRPYEIDLSAPIELGLTDVEFKAAVTHEEGEGGRIDAMLTIVISNTGDRPRSYFLFALLPGQPRQERLIPELQPGQMMVRRMRFNGVGLDSPIRAGLRESDGPAMLNVMLNEQRP